MELLLRLFLMELLLMELLLHVHLVPMGKIHSFKRGKNSVSISTVPIVIEKPATVQSFFGWRCSLLGSVARNIHGSCALPANRTMTNNVYRNLFLFNDRTLETIVDSVIKKSRRKFNIGSRIDYMVVIASHPHVFKRDSRSSERIWFNECVRWFS